jgi:pyrimidine-nucleoside phosphorylase
MYSLIKNKQNFLQHSKEEIEYIVNGFTENKIPDYQMAAWLMAIYLNGMNETETANYTQSLTNSGKKIKFKNLNGPIIDKHSTGGVGDKISLILGPILAACDCHVPMIVGRGLGHTGGTLDKLESIDGYNGFLNVEQFKNNVREVGVSIIGQTSEICPADKKIYALRDITGTIESNSLICGSILSKKLAEGIDYLIMDIKVGNGAFMKDKKEAVVLGNYLKKVSEKFNLKMKYLITDMNQPLGNYSGLICEVIESINVLKGNGPNDILELIYYIGENCLKLAGLNDRRKKIDEVIKNGKAYEKFEQMVTAHGGKLKSIKLEPVAKKIIKADKEGYLNFLDTKAMGMSIIELGGGRKKIDDSVDSNAGFRLIKKHGEHVKENDVIAEIFCSNINKIESGYRMLKKSIQIINQLPNDYKLIY